ncbi:hypothetical protein [Paenibacillus sp. 23TSA30-6]|uniref:hypothetical protein n=1 Tax=Paenibacillus sp. 23TSA30-6 TaxID=2546104 RepID=UPI001787CA67|nr:hypothetical protein [Paenibacillus sp. 23TSA30-6]
MALQMGRIAVFLIVKTGSIGVYQVHTAVFLPLLQKKGTKSSPYANIDMPIIFEKG